MTVTSPLQSTSLTPSLLNSDAKDNSTKTSEKSTTQILEQTQSPLTESESKRPVYGVSAVETLDPNSALIYKNLTNTMSNVEKEKIAIQFNYQSVLFVASQVSASLSSTPNAPSFDEVVQKVQTRGVNMGNIDINAFVSSTLASFQKNGNAPSTVSDFFQQFNLALNEGYTPLNISV